MWNLVTCITQEHDLRLVLVAAVVCLVASFTTFRLYSRLRSSTERVKLAWLVATGMVAGAGVWSTHFVAMQAFQPSLDVGYEPVATVLSLLLAMAGLAASFAVAAYGRLGRMPAAMLAGAAAALSIGGMHYLGMSAYQTNGAVHFDFVSVAASLIVGALLAAAAFVACGAGARRAERLAGATLFLLAICAIHFIGMEAVTIVPDASRVPEYFLDRGPMVVIVSGLVGVIVLVAAGLLGIEAANQRQALNRLQVAIEAMPEGMVFFDAQDRCVAWNERFAELSRDFGGQLSVGLAYRDMLEDVLASGAFPDAEAAPEAWLTERLRPEFRFGAPRERRLPDGRWMRIEERRTADGGSASIWIDITSLKTAAEELARARDAAEAANRAKSEFLANMSHEIRTPLNGVVGMADVLADSVRTRREREIVGIIRNSAGALDRLLSDILDISQAESGQLAFIAEPFILGDAVRSAAGLWRIEAERKGLTLSVDVAPGADHLVKGDSLRLRQILGNLLSNAVKFTDRGAVRLWVEPGAGGFRFLVQDTGVGIEPDAQPHIFQRFSQADGSFTRRHGGSGLGLAIARQLVEGMGGAIRCESTPGQGSLFSVDLPLEPCAEDAVSASAASATQPPVVAEDGGHLRVLLVDDHPANRRVVELMLEGLGADITAAEDGSQAVDAWRQGEYDVVLMDMQMPVMDGVAATRSIRALEKKTGRAPTPIFMLTANAAPEDVAAGRAAGAQRHLTKPLSVAALFEAVASLDMPQAA